MNKTRFNFLSIVLIFMTIVFSVALISCSTNTTPASTEAASTGTGDSDGSSDGGSSDGGSSDSSGSSSSGYISVKLYHPGMSAKTISGIRHTYTINSKKAKIGGISVSASGTGYSEYKRVNTSGTLSYYTYHDYTDTFSGGRQSKTNVNTGSGRREFKRGKKYTINCYTGSVTQDN